MKRWRGEGGSEGDRKRPPSKTSSLNSTPHPTHEACTCSASPALPHLPPLAVRLAPCPQLEHSSRPSSTNRALPLNSAVNTIAHGRSLKLLRSSLDVTIQAIQIRTPQTDHGQRARGSVRDLDIDAQETEAKTHNKYALCHPSDHTYPFHDANKDSLAMRSGLNQT